MKEDYLEKVLFFAILTQRTHVDVEKASLYKGMVKKQ